MIGTGAVSGQELYPEQTSRARPLPAATGAVDRRSTGWCSRSTKARRRMVSRCERASSTCAVQLSPQEAPRLQEQQPVQGLHRRRRRTHTMFGLRVDRDPFRDPRVRRAIALTINRPDIIARVLLGQGTLGNDSPFWSRFPSTDPSINQRKQNVALAKALLQAAGQANPKFTITTWNGIELPDYAHRGPGHGAPSGYGHRPRGACRTTTTTVAEPTTTRRRRGSTVRRRSPSTAPRGAEPLPHGRLHVGRDLECRALQERRIRLGGAIVPRGTRHPRPAKCHEEARRPPPTRHAGDHVVLHLVRHRRLVQGSELPGRSHLARASRQDVARIAEWTRAAGARAPAAPHRRDDAISRYILKRLGLALITLFLLSLDRLRAAQLLPGRRRTSRPRAVRRPGGGRRLQPRARHRPAGVVQYWTGSSGAVQGDLGTSLAPSEQPVWDLVGAGARQLAEARRCRIPDRRAARHPRRRPRRRCASGA